MSLITSTTKIVQKVQIVNATSTTNDKDQRNNYIEIAKVGKEHVYFNSNVKKELRVKELKFPEDKEIKFIPFLDLKNKQRSASFISGSSGSGKSVLAAKLVKRLRKLRKEEKVPEDERAIHVFTTSILNEDPAFKDIENIHYYAFESDEFIDIYTQLESITDCIIIFDDWENIKDKKLAAAADKFIKDTLERGRKQNLDIVVIMHQTQQFNKTKPIIFECDTYYLNIQANKNSSRKFIESYMDLSKKQIDKIVSHEYNRPYTWSCFHKSMPQYYILDDTIKLL